MKTYVAAAAVVGAAVIGGGAAAITTLTGHHGSPTAGPSTSVSSSPSSSSSSSPSATKTTPAPSGSKSSTPVQPSADPTSSSGIACKRSDMFDTNWIFTRYPGPATEGGDSAAIQMVQRMLNYVTPSMTCLKDDGTWSPELGTAIKRFQSDHGLPPVNQAGPQTFTALQVAVIDRINASGAHVYADPNSSTVVTAANITSVQSARASLPGAKEDFITFIGTDGAKAAADAKKDCNGEGGDSVQQYDPSGFAIGGTTSCGGAAQIWSNQSGAWKVILGSQAEWNCTDLQRFHVPSRMYGALTECVEDQETRPYGHH
jgi:hypothetical protein